MNETGALSSHPTHLPLLLCSPPLNGFAIAENGFGAFGSETEHMLDEGSLARAVCDEETI